MIDKYNLKDFQNGWIHGNFEPSIFKSEHFELGIQSHKAGTKGQIHYHKESNECNVVLKGKVIINGDHYGPGEIFVIPPYTVSESEFLEDTILIVSRDRSVKDDKYPL